ncbi:MULTISPECIES: peptidyl-prolyl cis-trans isomerase [Bacillus]|uniref:peptidyl-prolyl cis-trans isomerase n=1 Tax=Bacillus TaxID=1386 RepID=UPI000BB893AF|nr:MULTISPECIES: peptidyl-prolyl cis-trans isomerase [Bacillus]
MQKLSNMKKEALWLLIFGLIIINCLTIAFLTKPFSFNKTSEAVAIATNYSEVVALVGDKPISKMDLLLQLENRYGNEELEDLINKEVINQMADKYDVTIPNSVINLEWKMYKTMTASQHNTNYSEGALKEDFKTNVLLEELLVKDVQISDEALRAYYEENKFLFQFNDNYLLSHIVLDSREEAERVLGELNNGSSFQALAMEVSLDDFTAYQGGNIGFINTDDTLFPKMYFQQAEALEVGQWSEILEVKESFMWGNPNNNSGPQYVILYLTDKLDAFHYSYEEVKGHIRRKVALEQMPHAVSATVFWDEVGVEWNTEN